MTGFLVQLKRESEINKLFLTVFNVFKCWNAGFLSKVVSASLASDNLFIFQVFVDAGYMSTTSSCNL